MKFKNNIVSLLAAAIMALLAFTSFTVQAQSTVGTGQNPAQYVSIPVPLPPYLTNFVGGGGTTNLVFNLSGGWTNQTITTNTTVVWTNTSASGFTGTFVTNTVITTNNAITYAQFDAQNNRFVNLELDSVGTVSLGLTNPVILTIAHSVGGVNFETTNSTGGALTTITNYGNGTAQVNQTWQLDMGGWGYGRIVTLTFTGTNSSMGWTNVTFGTNSVTQGFLASKKKGAAQ